LILPRGDGKPVVMAGEFGDRSGDLALRSSFHSRRRSEVDLPSVLGNIGGSRRGVDCKRLEQAVLKDELAEIEDRAEDGLVVGVSCNETTDSESEFG
jgi:hypothetical protein